jgi:steroid 5-alpha reductase family enzyme
MTGTAAFDIRYPIGGLFVILAVLLVPYGLLVESTTKSLDSNIDLWWGLVMLVFGILLLLLARAADRSDARNIEDS